MKKNMIWNIISFSIGSLALSFFSLIQKYILFHEIIFNIKGYGVPILFGGLSGLGIHYFFMKKNRLLNNIKNDNVDLMFQKDEIKSLYEQLEAYSQIIDQVNMELEITLKKYKTLVELAVNISKMKSYSEKDFLSEVFEKTKKIIRKYDSYVAFIFENDVVNPLSVKGYNIEDLKAFKLEKSIVENYYSETGIYKITNAGLKKIMSDERMEEFNEINPNSKELIYLNIKYENKAIGGLFFELDEKNDESYTDEDLKVIKVSENIVTSYYECLAYSESEENRLIDIVEVMTNMLEVYDPYTKGHSLNVANIAKKFGKSINLDKKDIKEVYLTGLIHDIGKAFIDVKILNKEEKLTEEEYEIIKKHPENGERVLDSINRLEEIKFSVKHHHERWDGKGYPDGLKEEEIPILTQIITIVDAYDAMTNNRPYRKALSEEEVLIEFKLNRGKQFSPKITDMFIKFLDEQYKA